MLQNHLRSAWRNLTKNKAFSFINIAGLSIAMAACLLILQYVSFQLSFDQFNSHVSDLYRVYNDRYQNGKLIQHGTITYSAIGPALQSDFPEVVNHTRVAPGGKRIITYGTKKIGEQTGFAVENSFLSMFSYPLLAGDKGTALKEPHSVIITQTMARSIFGEVAGDFQSLLGKTIIVGQDSIGFKITGILKDVPENSHLKFDFLISYITLYTGENPWRQAEYDFTDSDFWNYIQLKHGTDYRVLEAKLPAFSEKHFQGNKVSGSVEKFHLQPLSKAHLYSDFEYEIGETASATVVWGLLIIAVLIIVIAWVNYVNLSTAKSLERAKEVGVRKVSGATRSQLIRQFLTESLVINIAALLIALLIVSVTQAQFNRLVQHQLSLSYLWGNGFPGYSVPALLIALLATGIIGSGYYPAFVMSSFKPAQVLKGKYTTSAKGLMLRKGLVIGQFGITVALIIGSVVIYKQINFLNTQNLGFNMGQMLIIKGPQLANWDSSFLMRQNAFMSAVREIPDVIGAANSWRLPGDELGRNFDVRRTDAKDETHFTVRNNGVSKDFIDLYGMKLVAGRNFVSTDYNSDWDHLNNIILNEKAVQLLGFKSPQDALGHQVTTSGHNYEVVGVVGDFHQKSLRYAIEPTMFFPASATESPFSIKVNTQHLSATIGELRKKYDAFFPGELFDYYFLDEKFNQQYASDQLFGEVFAIFSGFAIFIACLGLLGLSLFSTTQRTKEIGVRKVLGASVSSIVILLSKDFIRLVIIAFLIASPVAWHIMNNWLRDFAYRIEISWWVFMAAGLLAITIALGTTSLYAIRAAMSNPVKSLRTD